MPTKNNMLYSIQLSLCASVSLWFLCTWAQLYALYSMNYSRFEDFSWRRCIYLIPRDVHPCHQDEQGEDELHQIEGGRKTNLKEYKCHVISIHWDSILFTDLNIDVDRVKIRAVDNSSPGPGQEEYKISGNTKRVNDLLMLSILLPMVEVANTVPSKHAVVLPLQNTLKTKHLTSQPRSL